MLRVFNCVRKPSHRLFSTARHQNSKGPIEEQTLPYYSRKRYYPVRIGDIFNDKYQIISKLGYGAYSTVWLAKDQIAQQFVSLKVCIQDDSEHSPITNEVKMLRHLSEHAKVDHPGLDFTRLATDIFEVDGGFGSHTCIASKPQGNSLRVLQGCFRDGKVPKDLVKALVHRLLFSLNFLHFRCRVVHTDITPQNILAKADTNHSFHQLEEQEKANPSIPIFSNGEWIYQTKSTTTTFELSGEPILTDLGQMRFAEPMSEDWWMPDVYRAPEVLLGLPWSYPVDIWSVGVMMLELLEGKNLFDPIDHAHNQYVLPLALAQYIGYLGHPPTWMLEQSPIASTYFDAKGHWTSQPPIPSTSLSDFITFLPPGEEKDLFMRFIRRILLWDPELRAVADELIDDPWLMMEHGV